MRPIKTAEAGYGVAIRLAPYKANNVSTTDFKNFMASLQNRLQPMCETCRFFRSRSSVQELPLVDENCSEQPYEARNGFTIIRRSAFGMSEVCLHRHPISSEMSVPLIHAFRLVGLPCRNRNMIRRTRPNRSQQGRTAVPEPV